MASETITLTGICSGGNHLAFTLTGAKAGSVSVDTNDVTTPMTDEELENVCKGLIKLAKVGRTVAQVKTLFQNGVTVTI